MPPRPYMVPNFHVRPDGKVHVQLDWRPGETGIFTRHEMMRLAIAIIEHVDPRGLYELHRARLREIVTANAGGAVHSNFVHSWLARAASSRCMLAPELNGDIASEV